MECFLIILPKGSLYKVNKISPSTEPCGTPWLTLVFTHRLLGDILGYTEHLSPLLSLLMDEISSLNRTLLPMLPPLSLCDFMSHRVQWTLWDIKSGSDAMALQMCSVHSSSLPPSAWWIVEFWIVIHAYVTELEIHYYSTIVLRFCEYYFNGLFLFCVISKNQFPAEIAVHLFCTSCSLVPSFPHNDSILLRVSWVENDVALFWSYSLKM